MKKTKLLPILLVAPLLASCGISKVKEPKFADLGKKLSLVKFSEALDKAGVPNKLDFMQDKKLPSSVLNETYKEYGSFEVIHGKKVHDEGAYSCEYSDEFKLDTKNVLLEHNQEALVSRKDKNSNGTYTEAEKTKSKQSYQEETINKKKFVVSINNEDKEYSRFSDSSITKADVSLDNYVKGEITDAGTGFTDMVYEASIATDEELKLFSFYQNGKVFTIEWKYENESKDDPYYDVKVSSFQRVQLDATKGNFKIVSWYTSEETKTIKQTFVGYDWMGESRVYFKGEVENRVYQSSFVATYEYKDVSLKKVDLSKYTPTTKGGKFE